MIYSLDGYMDADTWMPSQSEFQVAVWVIACSLSCSAGLREFFRSLTCTPDADYPTLMSKCNNIHQWSMQYANNKRCRKEKRCWEREKSGGQLIDKSKQWEEASKFSDQNERRVAS